MFHHRWITQLDLYLPTVACAYNLWECKYVKRLSDGAHIDVQTLTSGVSTSKPAVNDLLIWKKSDEQPVRVLLH
jgi:hypothetical protein